MPHFSFRLYVAGDGPHSALARANLDAICTEYLSGRCEIEVIDVLRDPLRAMTDGVMLTPLLVKLLPAPTRKIVGTLSQREPVLLALGLMEVAK
ncbi:hypothetical protein BH09SUM1_BH09SUM1_10380 [soil metagenome]